VNIVAYGHDSGTQDIDHATQPGSQIAVLAGYFGLAADWIAFQEEWQCVLNKYEVPYFHSSDYASKDLCARQGSFYFGWTPNQRERFLYELASKAPGNRVRFPFAASFNVAQYVPDQQTKSALRKLGLTDKQINARYPTYQGLFHEFFAAFTSELEFQKPQFDGQISFVVDRKEGDVAWQLAAGQMHNWFARDDHRLKGITFADKRKELPLQAADMLAYRSHQVWQNMLGDNQHQPWSKLDYILWGNFKDYEDFREHYPRFLGKDLTQLDGQ